MAIIDRRGATVSATSAPSSSTPNPDLAIKTAVRAASTGANVDIQAFGLGVLDGVQLAAGDRVLLKDQTDATQNGVYNASTGVWAMSTDFQNNSQLAAGLRVFVNSGALNGHVDFVLSATDPVAIGTSPLSFSPSVLGSTFYPVVHPSSGNVQGSGLPVRHSLVWSDANPIFWADTLIMNSTDPSALVSPITIGGTVTAGDIVTLRFAFASQSIPVSYTAKAGDTTATIAAGLVATIKANAQLYQPASTFNVNGGGAPGQILFVVSGASTISLDYNVTVPMTVTSSVSGAATETVSAPNGGNPLPTAWDTNPTWTAGRLVSGMAPPVGSQLLSINSQSSNSADTTTYNTIYGQIANFVTGSTAGLIGGKWLITTPSTTGALTQGVFVGNGFGTLGVTDKGIDTINTKQFWVNGAYEIYQNNSQLWFDTKATGAPFVFSTNVASVMGINTPPTGTLDVNGYMSSVGQAGFPTAGAGIAIGGTSSPLILSRNFGTLAWLATGLAALSWDFKPSNSATSGFTLSANTFAPDADNVSSIGTASLSPLNVYAFNHVARGSTSGTLTIKAAAIAGANTITLPAGTTDFSATGGTGQVVQQTTLGGAFTVGAISTSSLTAIANNTLLGNSSGVSAAPSAQTIGATLAFSGGALQTAAHTGDVTTAANSFATTIAPNAVTYAKLQQVAASSLVGNATGSLANAAGITLGATLAFSGAALQTIAHSGDATSAANSFALTVTKINGVDQTAAWTSYTPTVTSGTGTITTSSATGRYRQIGKTIHLEMAITVTTAGTGASTIWGSLPLTAAAFAYTGVARETVVSGSGGVSFITASGTTLGAYPAVGGTFIASGAVVVMCITYEIP